MLGFAYYSEYRGWFRSICFLLRFFLVAQVIVLDKSPSVVCVWLSFWVQSKVWFNSFYEVIFCFDVYSYVLFGFVGAAVLPFCGVVRCWRRWSAYHPERAAGCNEQPEAGSALCGCDDSASVLWPDASRIHRPHSSAAQQSHTPYDRLQPQDSQCQLGVSQHHHKGKQLLLA